ncbi:type II toxin-antitoxin system death-on-curing family toxin [Kytococcus schroeteri]|nr:Fic family protein [Kytococcus schroeteri]
MTVRLDLRHLLLMAEQEGIGPVRDAGLLASAAERPWTTVMGAQAYPSAEEKASALLHSVVTHHPLVDGNKRLGFLGALVLLDLQGLRLDLAPAEAFTLVMDVASGELRDVGDIARRVRTAQRA